MKKYRPKQKRCPRCGKPKGFGHGNGACPECLRVDMIQILTIESKKFKPPITMENKAKESIKAMIGDFKIACGLASQEFLNGNKAREAEIDLYQIVITRLASILTEF